MNIAKNAPIGVFDSGLGGLTLLRAFLQKMPEERFIYLGDTARLPYGSKSPQTITRYLQQNIQFLNRYQPKAIVVACNSASSVMTPELIKLNTTPLFEVITPGCQEALKNTQNQRIGVIGTRATIGLSAYKKKLQSLNPHVEVFEQACPLFVPFIEEGLTEDPLTNLIVYRYLQPLMEKQIDTLILGCTHYPLLFQAIKKVTGSKVCLVDSSASLSQTLFERFLKNKKSKTPSAPFSSKKISSSSTTKTPSEASASSVSANTPSQKSLWTSTSDATTPSSFSQKSQLEVLCTDMNPHYRKLIPQFLSAQLSEKINMTLSPVDL